MPGSGQDSRFKQDEVSLAELNPNAVTGLASNLNTPEIIGRFMEVEKRKVAPIQKRQEQKALELESWNLVKAEVEKFSEVAKVLSTNEVWEAKKVESSDPSVITAKATRRAKPGKHTIAVDAVALAHQITSQGFERPEVNIGTGKVTIQIGDEKERAPIHVTINNTNNTLEGLRQAINDAGGDVEAFVIKTGSAVNPYQLLLTSKLTGERGRIHINVELKGGEVEGPTYKNKFDPTAIWQGLEAEEPTTKKRGFGSSTPITAVIGEFTGEEDTVYTFTATQSGTVNSEQGVTINWQDDKGKSGIIELNKYNYVPGTTVEFADGLSIAFSDGEVISGDSFTVKAQAQRSELLWWLSPEQRAPQVMQPTAWSRQGEEGGLKVTGRYTGESAQTVVFRIEGSGQVGGPKPMYLHYEFTKTGERGKLNIGAPYLSENPDPGALKSAKAYDFNDKEGLFTMDFETVGGNPRQLSIGNGLFVEVPPGILNDGDTTSVEAQVAIPASRWWLPEEERGIDSKIDTVAKWEPYLDDDGNPISKANLADGLLPFGGKRSSAPIRVTGEFIGDLPKTYTFIAQKEGTVGVTRVLNVRWEDDQGNSGLIDFGEGYDGSPIDFDSGLQVALGRGRLLKDDSFTITTRTPTVQRPQDAILRLGASDLGGGVEIRRPTNHMDDVIPGLELDVLSTSEKPVTITVSGDTERAVESLRDFVDAYNSLSATVQEVTKFDTQSNTAAPLLSDRNVSAMHNDIVNTTISDVKGLPQSANMLFAVGLRINDKGFMSLDEGKLNEKINDNFASVANIFRSNGASDNSGIDFLGVSELTKISPSGYKVDIQQVASKGYYLTPPMKPSIMVDDSNDSLIVFADGRRSEELKLTHNTYTPGTLAREIQTKLANDKIMGKRAIQVMEQEGRLKFVSGMYGGNSVIRLEPVEKKDPNILGMMNGEAVQGKDVQGTIDGISGSGRGQLLVGKEKTDADGLRLYVSLNEEQIKSGVDATIVVTKGVGVQLDEKMRKMLNPANGSIKQVTGDIAQQIKNFDSQVKRLNERMDAKRQELQTKFTKLESTLGRLKSQQSYLGQQLASLGGGGGGGGGGKGK